MSRLPSIRSENWEPEPMPVFDLTFASRKTGPRTSGIRIIWQLTRCAKSRTPAHSSGIRIYHFAHTLGDLSYKCEKLCFTLSNPASGSWWVKGLPIMGSWHFLFLAHLSISCLLFFLPSANMYRSLICCWLCFPFFSLWQFYSFLYFHFGEVLGGTRRNGKVNACAQS